MSLQTQLHSFVLRTAQEFNAVTARIGQLSALSTTDKTNIVAALNEVRSMTGSDTAANTALLRGEIATAITNLRTSLLDGAGEALDTLKELAAALGNDANFAATTAAALGNRVRFDAEQVITPEQQARARSNIGATADANFNAFVGMVGDTTINYVAVFEAALV